MASLLTTPAKREQPEEPGAWRNKTPAILTLERFIQDQTDPENPNPSPKFHTGRLPNNRSGDGKPRLLLMGQRRQVFQIFGTHPLNSGVSLGMIADSCAIGRSGKSSISSVVFHKMPPAETLFLESTARIQKDAVHSFMDFQVWDFPGQLDFLDPAFDVENIFGEIGALIWVIDAQDEYLDALVRLNNTILLLQQHYPSINIEVFIHKVDALSEDYKFDIQRDIVQRTQDELSDAGYENAPVSFHLTSIYDHSIFEAFSKVIQKLIPQLPTLEGLLNILCSNSGMEKAYIFDCISKIYIATDSSPVDMQSYEICSDYIDVIVDVSEIYGWDRPGRVVEENECNDQEAESVIRLQNGMILYLKEINKYLVLICIMKEESIKKKGLIDYNCGVFQDALAQVFGLQRS